MDREELIALLRQQADADEQWARAANKGSDGHRPPADGVHWTWAYGDDWDPMAADPVLDEHLAAPDGSHSFALVTLERWPLGEWLDFLAPHHYLSSDEVDAAAAGHIVRWDPARVLADVEARRQLLALAEHRPDDIALTAVLRTYANRIGR